jgi:hypothetical protein
VSSDKVNKYYLAQCQNIGLAEPYVDSRSGAALSKKPLLPFSRPASNEKEVRPTSQLQSMREKF